VVIFQASDLVGKTAEYLSAVLNHVTLLGSIFSPSLLHYLTLFKTFLISTDQHAASHLRSRAHYYRWCKSWKLYVRSMQADHAGLRLNSTSKCAILFCLVFQGSGKGTQGKISSGKICHEGFWNGAELVYFRKALVSRPKVKEIIETGRLVSDEIVMDVIENFLRRLSRTGCYFWRHPTPRKSEKVIWTTWMESLGRIH